MKNIALGLLKKLKKKWKLVLGIVIILALILGFSIRSKANNEIKLSFTNPNVETITKTLEASGHVNAKEKARLRFAAGGKVVYLGAQEGEAVTKWQTIATIDRAALEKTLEKSLNLYMKERWDWEDVVDDGKGRTLLHDEQKAVDKDQWDLDNTVIDVEIQDIAIQNTAIYAPFEGILTYSPTAVTGVQLLATDYFEIVNPNTLIFRAAVDESDISLVSEGQEAKLILDSFEDDEIPTTVSYIAYTSTETSSGTSFIVEFPLNEVDIADMLRIGMNGDIDIILETKNDVLTIPTISLIERDEKSFVQVKTGENQAEEREVVTGLETEDTVEILEGLSQSDEIVVPEQ